MSVFSKIKDIVCGPDEYEFNWLLAIEERLNSESLKTLIESLEVLGLSYSTQLYDDKKIPYPNFLIFKDTKDLTTAKLALSHFRTITIDIDHIRKDGKKRWFKREDDDLREVLKEITQRLFHCLYGF
jgi:hypothetical protein